MDGVRIEMAFIEGTDPQITFEMRMRYSEWVTLRNAIDGNPDRDYLYVGLDMEKEQKRVESSDDEHENAQLVAFRDFTNHLYGTLDMELAKVVELKRTVKATTENRREGPHQDAPA